MHNQNKKEKHEWRFLDIYDILVTVLMICSASYVSAYDHHRIRDKTEIPLFKTFG